MEINHVIVESINPALYLGKYLYIQYSVHELRATMVACGFEWALFDNGTMLYTPSITNITTEIPVEIKHKLKVTIPFNLGDLFT